MPSTMTVSRLSTTPVKGLALHHPEAVEVTSGGVVGDRAFFLVDAKDELISCTDIGDLMRVSASYDAATGELAVHGPDGVLRSAAVEHAEPFDADFYGLRTVSGHVVAGWDALFTEIAGQPLRLVQGTSGGFDVGALTLLGDASTDDLAARNASPAVDARRFRMNVEIAGSAAYAEDAWEGRELRVGHLVVRVGGPVKRCAATTRDPDTGEIDLQTLRMIGTAKGRHETPEWGAGFYFGVYAQPLGSGRIALGDEVTLLD